LSPLAQFTITCGSSYVIRERDAPENPQVTSHLDSSWANSYRLPIYVSTEVGCVVDKWELSTSNTEVITPSNLATPVYVNPYTVVKPLNQALHQTYVFYVKATVTDGGSNGFFGPYTLHVGCLPETVSYSDSFIFLTSAKVAVGASLTRAYQFNEP
jgi:hypothetical protein